MYFNPIKRHIVSTFFSLLCAMPLLAQASAARRTAPWPSVQPLFESSIRYGDPSRKADPFITVRIGGKPARMLLVDLTINGRRIVRDPVAAQTQAHDGGTASLGAIGMDVLRNRIVFHDNERHRFAMIERLEVPPRREMPRAP